MAIIDAGGLFSGDRLRRCSNAAQLHWPRMFLASDGFGRLELNYHKIIARAYATFNPVPSESELQAYLREYSKNYLLFVYGGDGQVWGQWDTPPEFLPRYKTAIDRRSPIPPEPEFLEWKKRYRAESTSVPKCFMNLPESFLCGKGLVGYGVGKEAVGENQCASTSDARLTAGTLPSIDDPPFGTTEPDARFPAERGMPIRRADGLTPPQEIWFSEWWAAYWLHKAKKAARRAFGKQVKSAGRFERVMDATRLQAPEMLNREPQHRPHGATWLNGQRWEDEPTEPAKAAAQPAAQGPKRVNGTAGAIEEAMRLYQSRNEDDE